MPNASDDVIEVGYECYLLSEAEAEGVAGGSLGKVDDATPDDEPAAVELAPELGDAPKKWVNIVFTICCGLYRQRT